jgi:hypothetical protein
VLDGVEDVDGCAMPAARGEDVVRRMPGGAAERRADMAFAVP